jgi:hypothetical protein
MVYIMLPAVMRVGKYMWLFFYIFSEMLILFSDFDFFIKAAYQ